MFSSFFQPSTSVQEYDNHLPEHIRNKAAHMCDHDVKRIMNALHFNKNNTEIKVNELNESKLNELANATNCSVVQYSGNCVLVSRCLLYNLKSGRNVLAVSNTYPILEFICNSTADKILFEKALVTYKNDGFYSTSSVDGLEKGILNAFTQTGERNFIIEIHHHEKIPLIGWTLPGHDMNAVVVGSGENAEVIFVDAQRPGKHIVTKASLAQSAFCTSDTYKILYHEGPTLYKELAYTATRVPTISEESMSPSISNICMLSQI